jgi:hypothetical protein
MTPACGQTSERCNSLTVAKVRSHERRRSNRRGAQRGASTAAGTTPPTRRRCSDQPFEPGKSPFVRRRQPCPSRSSARRPGRGVAHRDGWDLPRGLRRPALADHDSQFTESVHYTLTPGGDKGLQPGVHDSTKDQDLREGAGCRRAPPMRCCDEASGAPGPSRLRLGRGPARSAAAPLRRTAANRDAQSALM